jgi:hypothetical protein
MCDLKYIPKFTAGYTKVQRRGGEREEVKFCLSEGFMWPQDSEYHRIWVFKCHEP